jgi:hypothetical protein
MVPLDPWELLSEQPRLFERGPDPGVSGGPAERGIVAPYDILVPRNDLGPGSYWQFSAGSFVPNELLQGQGGYYIRKP